MSLLIGLHLLGFNLMPVVSVFCSMSAINVLCSIFILEMMLMVSTRSVVFMNLFSSILFLNLQFIIRICFPHISVPNIVFLRTILKDEFHQPAVVRLKADEDRYGRTITQPKYLKK